MPEEHGISGFAFDQVGAETFYAIRVVAFGEMSEEVTTRSPGAVVILRIHKELDRYTAPCVKTRIDRAAEVLAVREVIPDFEHCDFLVSTGLARVLGSRGHLGRQRA